MSGMLIFIFQTDAFFTLKMKKRGYNLVKYFNFKKLFAYI